jgi:type II secretory pathway pseudopilin PulG
MINWKNQKNSGMTLLEVTVAISIFLLILFSLTAIMTTSFRTQGIIWEQLGTQSEGRRVEQQFVNEIRRATNSSVGAYPFELALDNEIIFYSNIDTDLGIERVHYFLTSTTLMKGIVDPTGDPLTYNTSTEVVSAAVHSMANGGVPIFSYYDGDYSYMSTSTLPAPVDVTDIDMVGINLTLERDPNYSPTAFHIESKAKVRNNK